MTLLEASFAQLKRAGAGESVPHFRRNRCGGALILLRARASSLTPQGNSTDSKNKTRKTKRNKQYAIFRHGFRFQDVSGFGGGFSEKDHIPGTPT